MKLFELAADGELTRDMIREYGDEYTLKERIANKNYGLGHLKLKDGHKSLLAFYEQENNTIKTHFDWTKKGAVIRMRTMKNNYAIGIKNDQIEYIQLTKTEDDIFTIPLTPFWILLKLNVRISIAKWFRIRPERFYYGPVFVELILIDNEKLRYELSGDLWEDSLSTFGVGHIKNKIKIQDLRQKTNNKNASIAKS